MSLTEIGNVARGVMIDEIQKDNERRWLYDIVYCHCIKCEKKFEIKRYFLLNPNADCICECSSKRIRHGMSNERIYIIYAEIKERTVLNTGNKDFIKDYINRGIGLCDEWQGKYGFKNFYEWSMANGYADNLSIDRIDNDKGYSPDNCRWTTQHVQNCNRRNTKKATIDGITKAVADWCIEFDLDYNTVYGRIRKGWTTEKAILTPVLSQYQHKKGDFISEKAVNQFTKSHVFVKKWDSVYQASKELNIRRVNILNCCKKINNTCKGFIWEFAK